MIFFPILLIIVEVSIVELLQQLKQINLQQLKQKAIVRQQSRLSQNYIKMYLEKRVKIPVL